jgi:uncharacterized protein (TIGR02145 family)
MKKVSLILSAVVTTAMILSSCGEGASNEESTSNEVGTSNEVTIGNQVWMTKNLNVDKFRNGDPIPEAKTDEEWKKAGENKQPAWCYYDNDPANGAKYGKLYNWYAVNDPRGLAPEGWKIPSHDDWGLLIDYLGGSKVAGKKLKSTSGWYQNGNGTNEGGFSGLPGGVRSEEGIFLIEEGITSIGALGFWWSSTTDEGDFANSAWKRNVFFWGDKVEGFINNKGSGFSVRCIKD